MGSSTKNEPPDELQKDLMALCIKHGLEVVFLGKVEDRLLSKSVGCSVVGYLPIPKEIREWIANGLIDSIVKGLADAGMVAESMDPERN